MNEKEEEELDMMKQRIERLEDALGGLTRKIMELAGAK